VGVQIPKHDYKSLHPVVMIRASLINTHTETGFDQLSTISSVPTQLSR